MKLPRGRDAIIPPGKIENYCLNPVHSRGGHKARVFASALGIAARDAGALKAALLKAAREGEARLVGSDAFGEHYRIDHPIQMGARTRVVRMGWTVRIPDGPPYLTTAFVLTSSHGG